MDYRLHDTSRFPFVALLSDRCVPGFAADWGHEMDALLAARTPFVLAFEPAAIAETPEDFKVRARWFKVNRTRLRGNCAAMVAVVPSAEQRQELVADLSRRSRGFDVRYVALDSFATAEARTATLIAEDRAGRPRA